MALQWKTIQHRMAGPGNKYEIKQWVGVQAGWVLKRTLVDVLISCSALPLSADKYWDTITVGYIVWPDTTTGHSDQDPFGTPDAGWQVVRSFPILWTFVPLWQSSSGQPAQVNQQKLLGSAGTWQIEDVQTARDITVNNPASQATWDLTSGSISLSFPTDISVTVSVRALWSHP